jgi:hypothetical protein
MPRNSAGFHMQVAPEPLVVVLQHVKIGGERLAAGLRHRQMHDGLLGEELAGYAQAGEAVDCVVESNGLVEDHEPALTRGGGAGPLSGDQGEGESGFNPVVAIY